MLDQAATVSAVLTALTTARIAHLAAHGNLVTDNPLFSTLRLHDGSLVAYDLERVARVPHTVVLASCDSGRSVVRAGDELLGLSATFIARGTAQLVASVLPIADAETAPLMIAMHRRIAVGEPASIALAHAQQEMSDRGRAEMAAAAGFVCIGGGSTSPTKSPPVSRPCPPTGSGRAVETKWAGVCRTRNSPHCQ